MYTQRKMKVAHALKLDGMIKKGGLHINDALVTYEQPTRSCVSRRPNSEPALERAAGQARLRPAISLLTPEFDACWAGLSSRTAAVSRRSS